MSDETAPTAGADAMVTVAAPHSLERRHVVMDVMSSYLASGWSVVGQDYDDPALWTPAPEGGWEPLDSGRST